MNALAQISFETAYRQLQSAEREFVDNFVENIELVADREKVRLETVLYRPLPSNLDARAASMLSRSMVRAAITERVKELAEAAELSVYKTLKELRAIAYSNIAHYMKIDDFGEPSFDLSGCTPEQLSAIKTIKIEETLRGRKLEFVLHDKMAALSMVAKHQGLDTADDDIWTPKPASVKPLAGNISDDDAAALYARSLGN